MPLEYQNSMKVRYYECDTQGVVNHANYLHYFETARLEMMATCGLYLEDLAELGINPMVRNANVSYKYPLRHANEFVCNIRIERKGVRYFFQQELYIADNILCASATIEIVCVNNGKVIKPVVFDQAFAEYIHWL